MGLKSEMKRKRRLEKAQDFYIDCSEKEAKAGTHVSLAEERVVWSGCAVVSTAGDGGGRTLSSCSADQDVDPSTSILPHLVQMG